MDNKGFKDLENFYLAYKSRFKEYMQINKLEDVPKILLMHWGGIVIETYIKHILVQISGAKKCNSSGNLWYTMDGFNYTIKQGNMRKNKYKNYICTENPGHAIEGGIRSIDFLNELITSNIKILRDVKVVEDPLRKESKNGFIDLRYIAPESVDRLDKLFIEWNESFKSLLKWLIENTKNIEVRMDE
ncbi:hypothetical protein CLRAG_00820 [Clostridium ragsdalei P11]|uniref:Uncharacterized protein n=1 Tax=Clostridium ragsdalei P11 TaxID=1353534 RepID=A0A1A6B4H8_9CLOT|nr:hypothetical protein [Clostridium ragsdalei]OBR97163.1 hypothetical protein CLRAG_00820 [Clostridium ragsdalei P11]